MSKLALLSFLLITLAAGCSYKERPSGSGYGAAQTEGSQVVSSPQYRVTGTAATAQPPVYSSSAGGAGSAQGLSQSDAALVSQVREALSRSDTLAPLVPNLNLSAQNGVVTVAGTVPSQQQKEMIDALVAKSVGAANMRDQLQVGLTPTGRPEPASRVYSTNQATTGRASGAGATTGDIFNLHVQGLNDADRTVAQRILEGLRTDQALASLLPTVNINISGGRVVLQGTVQSEQQKQTIASVVERAAGAGQVENQLAVNPGPGNATPNR